MTAGYVYVCLAFRGLYLLVVAAITNSSLGGKSGKLRFHFVFASIEQYAVKIADTVL